MIPTGSAGWTRVAASSVLFVFGDVALRTVFRGEGARDLESAVVDELLPLGGSVTIEAVHSDGRVTTALELMHDRRGFVPVTLGALPRGFRELRRRLTRLDGGPSTVQDQRRCNDRRTQKNGNEYGPERHARSLVTHAFPLFQSADRPPRMRSSCTVTRGERVSDNK